MKIKYPFVKQKEMKDCAVASLSMIIQYYKGYLEEETLSDMLETDRNGTTAYSIVKVASDLGFKSYGLSCNCDHFLKEEILLPCIAHVTIDSSYQHFIVIYKIDKKRKELTIADPASGIKKMKISQFSKIFNNVVIILYPIKTIPIDKNSFSFFEFLFQIIKKYKKDYINILLLSLFITFLSLCNSFYLKLIINSLQDNSSLKLLLLFLLFLEFAFLKNFSSYVRNKIILIFSQKIEISFIMDTFCQIMSLPYKSYRNKTTGDILSRINDATNVLNTISNTLVTCIYDFFLAISAAFILISINKNLFLFVLLFIFFYSLLQHFVSPILNKNYLKIQNEKSNIMSFLVEKIGGFETIKGLSLNKVISKKFEYYYVKYLKNISNSYQFENKVYFFKECLYSTFTLFILFLSSIYVINSNNTLGDLIIFSSLLIYFIDPIKNILNIKLELKEAKISLKRIYSLHSNDNKDNIFPISSIESIELKNVSFYNQMNLILKNVNITLKKADKVMVIGQSGCGKSTLLKILKGYYPITSGEYRINNTNNSHYQPISAYIDYVSQNEILFTDSILNNVILNRNVEWNKLEKILKLCEVDSIVKNNNLGYNYLIEENGFNLSGGEKQRIIIARSLINDNSLLLIDEGFSEMDVNLERRILKKMFKQYPNKTIVIVSHRNDNMDLFDKIISVKDKIVKEVIRND